MNPSLKKARLRSAEIDQRPYSEATWVVTCLYPIICSEACSDWHQKTVNPLMTGGFLTQKASNAESVSV